MENLEKILKEMSEINFDKKCKAMLKGDVHTLVYCQGFESAIEIIGYHFYKLDLQNKGE